MNVIESVDDRRMVRAYRKEHPNSKMSYNDILKMLNEEKWKER